MPIGIRDITAGTDIYESAFIGPVDETLQLTIDISGFTTDEIDANGDLKPNVPLAVLASGLLGRAGVQAAAGTAVSAPYAGNTGTGTMGAVTVSAGAKAGVYRLTIIAAAANAGKFLVEDPDGVEIGVGTVGVAFSAGGLAFTLADGATDFAVGDGFTVTVTLTAGGAATTRVYGVTVEAQHLPLATIPPTNTTLASETGDCPVTFATCGTLNRDITEDVLGRALTAAELAGFVGSRFTLTQT